MHRYILLLFSLATGASGQTAPSIALISNAAMPGGTPGYTHLVPRSMASIFGSNLSSSTTSTNPPWQDTLGGVEVHIIIGIFTPCTSPNPPATLSCDIVADLLYVSPTQINFIVPDISPGLYGQSQLDVRVALVRDGVLFDSLGCNQDCFSGVPSPGGGFSNGIFVIDATDGDFAIFEAGYDCLFSASLDHPSSCGVSWSPGEYRTIALAITDANGTLISSGNPIHQGEIITLWSTGLEGLSQSSASGPLQQIPPVALTFSYQVSGITHTMQTTPLWAGESPQFVGMDQINVPFPSCGTTNNADTESRLNAFISFPVTIINGSSIEQTSVNFYLPLLVRVGDPECAD